MDPISQQLLMGAAGSAAGIPVSYWIATLDTKQGQSITSDSKGNVYAGGVNASNQSTIAKFDDTGLLLWQRIFGENGTKAVAVDKDGNVFVGTGSSGYPYPARVAKFDKDGTFLWQVNLGRTDTNQPVSGLDVDSQGNAYFTFYSGGAVYNTLIKLSPTGTVLWQQQYFQGGGTVGQVRVDKNDNIYVASSEAYDRIGLYKYNASGTQLWRRVFGITNNAAAATAIALSPDGDVYMTGYTGGFPSSYRLLLMKIDPSGSITWQRQFNQTNLPSRASSVAVDSKGWIYVSELENRVIYKYSSAGVLQWGRRLYSGYTAWGLSCDDNAVYGVGSQSLTTGGSAAERLFLWKLPSNGSGTGRLGPIPGYTETFEYSAVIVQDTTSTQTTLFNTVNSTAGGNTVVGTAGTASTPTNSTAKVPVSITLAPSGPLSVEDVFSTTLYRGTYSGTNPDHIGNHVINNIDLATHGGLVWTRKRASADSHYLVDTARGLQVFNTDTNYAQNSAAQQYFNGFVDNGFVAARITNNYLDEYVSWTFRKAPKFFDVVTYTGNGTNRTIAHNLGSVPGCIIVKRTDTTGDWQVYHRSIANTEYLVLNSTAAKATGATRWNSTTPTSTVFSLGTDASVNASGGTYVAYIVAHDAGGFGASGNDNVVSCGSFATDGSGNATVNLGWEPQFVVVKRADGVDNWNIYDVARGYANVSLGQSQQLAANSAVAESAASGFGYPISTGFVAGGSASATYVYIAIRRGPMRTPTDATKVFNAVARTGTGANATVTCGFQADACFIENRTSTTLDSLLFPRLTGTRALSLTINNAEAPYTTTFVQANPWDVMDGIKLGTTSTQTNASGVTFVNYFFKRAPCFFDIATYTGTGATLNVNHNLGATPELMFVKSRTTTASFQVYFGDPTAYLGASNFAKTTASDRWNNTSPTPSVFTVGTVLSSASASYIAYLFASCPGVSKVGTYTGTAATLDVNCGFTGGARFVLIKRIDSSGDWFYWDTARGIIAGNDPYLINDTGTAEVTNTDYIDPLATGFQITANAPAAINASGGTYLYLAIA